MQLSKLKDIYNRESHVSFGLWNILIRFAANTVVARSCRVDIGVWAVILIGPIESMRAQDIVDPFRLLMIRGRGG